MQFHNLKRNNKRKRSQIVGRGGKRGKTSGRGTKGQKARAGHKIRPEMRDIIMRMPKLRGRGSHSLKSFRDRPFEINLADLNLYFEAGETVSPKSMAEKGILKKVTAVKILGSGDLEKKLSFEGCQFSVSAKTKVEKGGSVIK